MSNFFIQTLAFEDLNEKNFNKAKVIFEKEKFENKILVDHIVLAKENEKGQWKEDKRIKF